MDQNQFPFAHLPGLLHKYQEGAIPHDFPRMIAVQIDLHIHRYVYPKVS